MASDSKINKVIILGAGASHEVGFPLGRSLMFDMADFLSSGAPIIHIALEEMRELATRRGEKLIWAGEKSTNLVDQLQKRLLSANASSIDVFLEHNPMLADAGRLAIAATLLPFERDGDLRIKKDVRTWYECLWNQIYKGFHTEHEGRMAFVTLNYDRSLERYLERSAEAFYEGMTSKYARELVRRIPIIHLHGSLGDLDDTCYGGEMDKLRKEGLQRCAEMLVRSASGIRLIHEDSEYTRAALLIRNASRAMFLGTSYHLSVLEKLMPKHLYEGRSSEVRVFGSTCKMSTSTRVQTERYFKNVLADANGWRLKLHDGTCLETLDEYGLFD